MRHAIARLPLHALLAAALAVLVACQDDAARLEEHMARGTEHFEAERYREAIIEFKSVLQIDPNHAPAHYELSHAYLVAGKTREGFWELRETVRLDPSHNDAKLEFAQLAIYAGEKEEALKQANAVVEAEPENPRAYLVKAQALGSLDRHDEALAAYAAGVQAAPEDENALRAYGKVLLRFDRVEQSEAIHRQLIEAHPDAENYLMLAHMLRVKDPGPDGYAEREEVLTKAVELAEGENRPMAIIQLAGFYQRVDRLEDAYALLDKAIAEEEEKLQIIYYLARLHRSQGDRKKADELIESTAEAEPDNPAVYVVLASYRARNGNFERALEAAQRAVELDPEGEGPKLQKAEILMELGFREDRQGAVDEARTLTQEILAAEPSNPQALFANAKLDLGEGRVNEAIVGLKAALDSRPNWAQAHYLLGVALAVKGDNTAARTELAQALENDAGLLDAKHVLAQVHFKLGEYDYCIERGREFLREKPKDTKVRLMVAQSLVRLNKIDEAERELDQIPADKRGGEVMYALGRIRQVRGDKDGAREYLEKALEELPTEFDVLQSLLVLDRAEDRVPESRARIEAALEANPENAKLYQLAGMVAVMQDRPEDAEASFRKSIEVDPEDLTSYERLARFYARTGRLDDTAKTYEEALEVKPNEAQLHHFLGVLYELSGDRDRAIERYEDAIRHRPELAEAKNNLAYIYAESGKNLDRALDLAQEAKQQLPESASVADTLGWVLFKRGVPSAAISYLKEAEAATGDNDQSLGVVRYHLAQAYEANGENDKALKALDRSLTSLEGQMAAIRERGDEPGDEPGWATDARTMQTRLQAAG